MACAYRPLLRGHIALDDENSYVAAAEAGLGVAQIPAFVLKEAMERGSLELLLGDWFAEPAPLNVVYPENRHLSSKIRVFVDWVAELFGEHDGIQLRSTLRRLPPDGAGHGNSNAQRRPRCPAAAEMPSRGLNAQRQRGRFLDDGDRHR